jgi:hypothetical protein
MSNPEFQMKGVSFVISTTTNAGHPLPFKVKLPNGRSAEIQHSLRDSFTVVDVINELRLLANNLEATAMRLEAPSAQVLERAPSP